MLLKCCSAFAALLSAKFITAGSFVLTCRISRCATLLMPGAAGDAVDCLLCATAGCGAAGRNRTATNNATTEIELISFAIITLLNSVEACRSHHHFLGVSALRGHLQETAIRSRV